MKNGDVVYIKEDIRNITTYYNKHIYAGNKCTVMLSEGERFRVQENDCVWYDNEVQTEPPRTVEQLAAEIGIEYEPLHEQVKHLYTYFNHRCSDKGIKELLRHYFINKWDLIQLIKKHPCYNGNLQVVINTEIKRIPCKDEINDVLNKIADNVDYSKLILSKVNSEGLTKRESLLKELSSKSDEVDMDSENGIPVLKIRTLDDYNEEDYWIPSVVKLDRINHARKCFFNYLSSTVSEYLADNLNNYLPKTDKKSEQIQSGMKTSRAFNRIFLDIIGLKNLDSNDTTLKEYNRLFAEYADCINAKESDRIYVISLNPIDYLTMSFGNTWSSCHTIDAENKRQIKIQNGSSTYTGMHMGGTLSYMLDSVSFVTYMVNQNADKNHPEKSDKIYRNMCHYENNVLVQGRMYPQSKDGCTDLYKTFRYLMQENLCTMLNIPYVTDSGNKNDTWVLKGASEDYTENIGQHGVHYADTENFHDCNVSYIRKNWTDDFFITIGSKGICACCGRIIEDSGHISHNTCRF